MRRRSLNKQDEVRDLMFGEAKDARKKRKDNSKVEKFNVKMYKCNNFCWKKSEERNTYGQLVGPTIAYCKLVNKGCKITNCPLIKS